MVFMKNSCHRSLWNDKRVVLYTKVIPSILTTQNTQDRFIEVRLVDYDTEETVRNVTYSIVLETDNHQLIRDLLSSRIRPVKVKVEPHSNYLKITNFTSHKNGVRHSQSGNITIQGPILLNPRILPLLYRSNRISRSQSYY